LDYLAILMTEHVVGNGRHVEEDPAIHGLAAPDLVEDAPRGHVSRRRFLPDGVIRLHEPLARRVVETRARHERRGLDRHTARAERADQAPRIELDELHVAEDRPRLEGESVAAPRHVDRVARDAEKAAGPTRGKDRRARAHQNELGPVPPEAESPD